MKYKYLIFYRLATHLLFSPKLKETRLFRNMIAKRYQFNYKEAKKLKRERRHKK